MRGKLVCGFSSRFVPDSLSRTSTLIRIFEGVILHDELSLSIKLLSILLSLRYMNGLKSALGLCHNSARSGRAMFLLRRRYN